MENTFDDRSMGKAKSQSEDRIYVVTGPIAEVLCSRGDHLNMIYNGTRCSWRSRPGKSDADRTSR